MIRLVIFDVDGTLVDSQYDISTNMELAFGRVDQPWPGHDKTRDCIGLSLPDTMQKLAPDAGDEIQQALVEAYKTAAYGAAESINRLPVKFFPGALEALRELMDIDTVLLALATGKSQRGVDRFLKDAGFSRRDFVSIQTADDAPSKPNPAMVLNAMSDAGGLAGKDTVLVGDTSYDMEMAVNADAFALGVAWGYHEIDVLRRAGAGGIVNQFSQLRAVLEGIWNTSQ